MAARFSSYSTTTSEESIPSAKLLNVFDEIWKRLNQVSCPLCPTSNCFADFEHFLKPGESHIKLIQWIFANVDEELSTLVKKPAVNVELKATRILDIAMKLKLCTENDSDIIRGTAPAYRQLTFINYMLGLILARRRVDNENSTDANLTDTSSILSSATCLNDSVYLPKNYTRHAQFIDHIASKGWPLVFRTPTLRLPEDILQDLERRRIGKSENQTIYSPRRQLEMVKTKLSNLEMELKQHEDFTKSNVVPSEPCDENSVRQSLLNLMLTARDIRKEIDRFEDIFKPLLNSCSWNVKDNYSPIGESMTKVQSLMEDIENFFEAVRKLRESTENISGPLAKEVIETISEGTETMKLKNLDEWINILSTSTKNFSNGKRTCDSATSTLNSPQSLRKCSQWQRENKLPLHFSLKKDNVGSLATPTKSSSPMKNKN